MSEAGGTPTRPALPEPSAGSSDTAWSTSSEYRSSNGLQLIRAAEGYATRSTGQPGGQGKTVAVLDTPLDIRHPDLLTAGVRTKAFDFEFDNPDFNDPNIVHGTHGCGHSCGAQGRPGCTWRRLQREPGRHFGTSSGTARAPNPVSDGRNFLGCRSRYSVCGGRRRIVRRL